MSAPPAASSLPSPLAPLALVRCESAGLCCAFEAAKVGALLAVSASGIAHSTVPSLADLLHQPTPHRAATAHRLLELILPHGARRLVQVGEPVIHFSLPAQAIQPLPPLLAARLRPAGIRALAWIDAAGSERLVLILDAWRLASSPDHQP